MARVRLLDTSKDSEIGRLVVEFLEEEGYSPEEMVPGLVEAIGNIAEATNDPEGVLDEAANLLSDLDVL
jgi:hypothetical protein